MNPVEHNPAIHPVEPEEVMALRDGELEPEAAARVEAHLRECAECAKLAGELNAVSQQMQAWQPGPTPSQLHQRVADPPRSAMKKKPLMMRSWLWQTSAAAAILFVISLGFFGALSPNLLRSRITANETSSVSGIRTLNTVCVQYSVLYGGYPRSLSQLGPGNPPSKDAADLIDGVLASGLKSGYRYRYSPRAFDADGNVTRYSITAEPVSRETGQRFFYTDNTGVIRWNAAGPASASSALLEGYRAGDVFLDKQSQASAPSPVIKTFLGPMIVRTASLTIVAKEFENARAAVEQILRRHGGYVAELSAEGSAAGSRSLAASLRIPSAKLDASIVELKKLGRVEGESLGGEEVTKPYTDLISRQSNARNTEKRLAQVLENRTGKVADVLSVEKEIARVREEIEQLEAERKTLENKVEYATVQLRLDEEYKAQASPAEPSARLQMRNAAVEGYRSVVSTLLSLILFLLSAGPTLLLWVAILFWPARVVWLQNRREHKQKFKRT